MADQIQNEMMDGPIGTESPFITAEIEKRGVEFVLASELPRIWATGVQLFVNGDHTLIIFREQNMIVIGDEVQGSLKNVASLIMPTVVAKEFHRMLGEQLQGLDEKDG
jgi:hypothetical protein